MPDILARRRLGYHSASTALRAPTRTARPTPTAPPPGFRQDVPLRFAHELTRTGKQARTASHICKAAALVALRVQSVASADKDGPSRAHGSAQGGGQGAGGALHDRAYAAGDALCLERRADGLPEPPQARPQPIRRQTQPVAHPWTAGRRSGMVRQHRQGEEVRLMCPNRGIAK
jgi:hypothetical protein